MINSVYKTCEVIANKENYGTFTPARFNLLAKNAQIKILSDLIDQFRRSKADKNNLRKQNEIEQALDLFYSFSVLYRADVSGVIQKYFELPADLWIDDDYHYNEITPITIVSKKEFTTYLRYRDMKPDMDNPIAFRYGGKIEIAPTNIGEVLGVKTSDVSVGYYRQPLDPALSYISGTDILDPSEPNDFELPLNYHDKLIVEICLAVGIHLREEQVYIYARNERQQEINNENA